ncbi:hypothetical protein VTN00DRAFT_9900 [Thermoascus crustaceus]|uniref:uncharacterized protein n=1 Tax=Thermoascus crustaceus TaxID=5088 RepID=UPI00374406A9
MADPISLTANIAAVIGLIDVVYRAGKDIYGFIAKVKNASHEIQQLEVELQEVEFILANLRRYCERRQSRSSSSSSSTLAHDASSAVHRLCGTLEQLKGEYDSVSEIVARHITTKQGGSRQPLKNLRGKVDLVLKDLADCACILVANNLSFNDLALGDKLDGLHDSVASLDENTEARLTSIDSGLRALGSADYPSRHKNQIAWEKEANINSISTDAPLQVIDSLMAQLMNMRHSIQTRPWGCNGEHLQNAALPLMLFKPKIQEALKPRITRHISSYVVLDSSSPVFACVRHNDIDQLRGLLKSRKVTPTYAARHLRAEVCDLLNEGADPVNCRWDGANAIYDLRTAFWYRFSGYSMPTSLMDRMLRSFVAAGCDINLAALGGSLLHITVNPSLPGLNAISEHEIRALIELLGCLGADIENRNAHGLTPLLYNACIPQWHGVVVLRELLR